jgi:hypothetical protein
VIELCILSGYTRDISLCHVCEFCHRDGNMPVSFIQKYLMRKLELTSEAEVGEFVNTSLKDNL